MAKSGFWMVAIAGALLLGLTLWLLGRADTDSSRLDLLRGGDGPTHERTSEGGTGHSNLDSDVDGGAPPSSDYPVRAEDGDANASPGALPLPHVPWQGGHRYGQAMQAWLRGDYPVAIQRFTEAYESAPAGDLREEAAILLVAAKLRKGEAVDVARTLLDYLSAVARHTDTANKGSKSLSSRTIFHRYSQSGEESRGQSKFRHYYGNVARRALDKHPNPNLHPTSGHEEHFLELALDRTSEALNEVTSASDKRAIEAARGFLRLNVDLLRAGSRGTDRAVLKQRVLAFVERHGTSKDARVSAFVRYLSEVLPDWVPDATGKTRPYGRRP